MLTFKLPGQQIPQPSLQQWSDPPHEEQPDSPSRSPEATTRTLANRTLLKVKKINKLKKLIYNNHTIKIKTNLVAMNNSHGH